MNIKKRHKFIVNKLEKFQEEMGMNTYQFSKHLEINYVTLYKINKSSFPSLPMLIHICNRLHISLSEMIGENQEKTPKKIQAFYAKWNRIETLSKENQKILFSLVKNLKKEK